jgi:hypothetical protein
MVLVAMPWLSGIPLWSVKNEGQMAPNITRTVFAPFIVWMENQKTARIQREMIAT